MKSICKKILHLIFKVVAFLSLFIAVFYGSVIATSFLTRWTADNPIDNIPSLCFVAVDNQEQFVAFKKTIRQTNQIASTQQTLSKKDGLAYWELKTEKAIRTVYYADGDYFSWFRYSLNGKQITPLSCRIIGPATAIGGGFMGIFFFLLLGLSRGLYRWWKNKR